MEKVLLIEDDYVDIESVKRIFKKTEISVDLQIAYNGVDGLEMLTENSAGGVKFLPDIILLDINMPKMSGIEFLRIIKNYYSLKNIKIFILTTSSDDYDRMAVESLGIDGYLSKPLDFKNKYKEAQALLDELKN